MKNKILILFLFLSLNSFGQIPNTENFTFWDLADEFGWAHTSSFNLDRAFDDANSSSFDLRYYPHYLVSGANFNIENSQLNFRNYGGVHDGIPIPVAIGATNISRNSFQANWNSSVGATDYYIDIDIDPYFSHPDDGYKNLYASEFTSYTVSGLSSNVFYYYRVRSHTPNGVSANSNTQILRTATIWFLPSLEELHAMKENLYDNSIDGFTNIYYWSSSEAYADRAYRYYFGSGSFQLDWPKSTTYYVRAARSFWSSHVYSLGDAGYTGYIFYIVDNGGGTYTYYESSPVDQSTGQAWSNVTGTEVTGTSNAIGTGAANTLLIIGQTGHTNSAAKICNDLTLN